MPNMRRTESVLAVLTLLSLPALARAQSIPSDKAADLPGKTQPVQAPSAAETRMAEIRHRDTSQDPIRIYHLHAGSEPNSSNEVLTGMRLLLSPDCKMYLLPGQNTMLVRCNQEQLVVADQIMRDIDLPKINYRLTYTIVESDNGKRIGVQHFAMAMIPGVRTTLKDGSKVPVATGSYNTTGATAQTQFTYLDVGLNFDATLTEGAAGLRLSSKLEQSASAEAVTIAGVTEPIIRQAVLEGSATLQVGKPVMLGSLDVAASTRHLDVEVLLEAVK